MKSEARERLIHAASQLFAAHGFRGAPVRDICNLARANPGAISYHFGGKRQLYRAVLRLAAERLVAAAARPVTGGATAPSGPLEVLRTILARIVSDPAAAQLLLRDIADGGAVAVEVLEPGLRSALDALSASAGHEDAPRAPAGVRVQLLALAGPLFLLTAGWPVVARALELEEHDRERLLDDLVGRVLSAGGLEDGSNQ